MKEKTFFDLVSEAGRKTNVPAILIGGFAVNYHGVMRQTQDVDFLVEAEASEKVHKALLDLGYQCIYRSDDAANYVRAAEGLRAVWVRGRQLWREGWQRGLASRLVMAAAAAIVALAIVWGGYALTSYLIESRRDTPAKKMKKAFKSLFARVEMVDVPSGESHS